MLETALEYVEDGRTPIALRYKGKTPWFKWEWLQEKPPTPQQLRTWFAKRMRNIGWVTGKASDCIVVDTDSRDEAVWWYKNRPRTPLMSKTGRGVHFVYRYYPMGNRAKVLGREIDIRGDGGLLVVPPSTHENGKKYEWVEWPVDKTDIPVFDPEWIGEKGGKTATPSKTGFQQQGIRDPVQLVMSIRSIQGKDGSGACYKVCCILSEHFNFPESLRILHGWNVVCAEPRWSDDELMHKLTDAFKRDVVQGKMASQLQKQMEWEQQCMTGECCTGERPNF
jgi:hypothetical protein